MRFSLLNDLEVWMNLDKKKEEEKIIFKKIIKEWFTHFKILEIFRVDLWNQICYEALNTFNKLLKYACKLCASMHSLPLLL